MKAPDFSSYDLEYSELLGLEWRENLHEVQLHLFCPVTGWAFKAKRNRILRRIGLGALIVDPWTEYTIEILFLGVTDVVLNIDSEYPTKLSASDPIGFQSLRLTIDDLKVIELKNDVFRFYLRAEEIQLDFNFVDHIFRQLGSESEW